MLMHLQPLGLGIAQNGLLLMDLIVHLIALSAWNDDVSLRNGRCRGSLTVLQRSA